MESEVLKEARKKMASSVEHLSHDVRGLRSGRASPALVENIRVDYYGSATPLSQIAQVMIPEPRQIAIKPFDASALGAMAKAIQASDLGINPQSDGKVIRLTVPMLSEEQRKKLVAHLREMGENTRVAIRNTRRDLNKRVDGLKSSSTITEDDAHREKDEIQNLLKEHEKKIDELLEAKTREIMED